ncbi:MULTISPECIES: histidinol-phosphate transaminase [unclassified Ruegeria]|uniref:pyridoxal phosphate-dependent aminotransferase n=1 Tax=unclassified Ruegeria TaxID=2625375 RepID=UPI00148855E3|nr:MULTISPECIES: histidinol-phosphate transaminase [unclassified Ruegeria]NOD88087.1 aminotransferase class I/II-fold pyridoxal phosphate-dependent enzyme [Ruegeria sp. HKCCD4318]NOE14935.1 aminotransferase class I/II-fold pyridoxal phosphate-dependent enzyme [Ruegeria sp. HKCCD4318-2]NOG11462.1 aminotransferase class I/II-fold pyridoxal phosphate-dependent enzyme [Ruegeria sp. HKCCD4315]
MIRAVEHVRLMAAYALADLGGPETVSLAQNESAFPASPAAVAAGQAALDQMPLYPDPDWPELRAAIAETHGVAAGNILCGAGSMELIGCLIRAFAGPGDRVLGTDYGYAYVASATAQVQADYVKAREVDLTVSVDDILAAITPQTRIAFVCNPGNPTGTLIPNAEIVRLRNALPADVLLVFDQAYAEFADQDQNPDEVFALVDRGDTVVMRTFSKAYGLAGARVGWGLFPDAIAGEVRKLLNPNNVSIPSQAMATAAMRDQDHMLDTVSKTAAIRDQFANGCRALGLTVAPSHTNFVLIRFADVEMAQKADAALRAQGLLMRGMGGYGLGDCLRATICEEPVMDRCLTVLKEVTS